MVVHTDEVRAVSREQRRALRVAQPRGPYTLSYSVMCVNCGTHSPQYALPRNRVQPFLDAEGWTFREGVWLCATCIHLPQVELYLQERQVRLLPTPPKRQRRRKARTEPEQRYCLSCGKPIDSPNKLRKRCEECSAKARREYSRNYTKLRAKKEAPHPRAPQKTETVRRTRRVSDATTENLRRVALKREQEKQERRAQAERERNPQQGANQSSYEKRSLRARMRSNPDPSVIHTPQGKEIERYIDGRHYSVGMHKHVNYHGAKEIVLRGKVDGVWHWDMVSPVSAEELARGDRGEGRRSRSKETVAVEEGEEKQ